MGWSSFLLHPWRCSWLVFAFGRDSITSQHLGSTALGVFTDIGGHDNGIRVDNAPFFGLAKGVKVGVECAGKQAAADRVAKPSPGFDLVLKPSIVRAEVHALASAQELERPRPGFNPGFEFELAGQARSNRRDAFNRFEALTFVGDQMSLQPPDGNRRFVHDFHDDLNDVLVVIVNLHDGRVQRSVEGTGSCGMVVTHRGSPNCRLRRLYFKGVSPCGFLNAIATEFPRGETNPQRPPCGASGRWWYGTLLLWIGR